MSLDWGGMFGLSVSPLELIIRGSAMYLFLFVLFRVVIRRRVCQLALRLEQSIAALRRIRRQLSVERRNARKQHSP